MERADITIIGAGIIGLALGMKVARRFPNLQIKILEKENQIGSGQTGHNSGVMHTGVYYQPGSLKARLCVSGHESLVRYCSEKSIPYNLTGKLIVAKNEAEVPALEALWRNGVANGVKGLELIGPDRIRSIEPHVKAAKAIYSPRAGIVDFQTVAKSYANDFKDAGGTILLDTNVQRIRMAKAGLVIESNKNPIETKCLINCAGLYADRIAASCGLKLDTRIIPFRGEYFWLRGGQEKKVQGLIYPVPNPALPFLGVHLMRTLGQAVKVGPNAVLAFSREGYRSSDVNLSDFFGTIFYGGFWRMVFQHWKTGLAEFFRSASRKRFAEEVRGLLPDVSEENLVLGPAGVRAQCVEKDGRLYNDFKIMKTERSLHVLNVPSPAATASLAISDHIMSFAGLWLSTFVE